MGKFIVRKASGASQRFSRKKLIRSLVRSGISNVQARRIVGEVENLIWEGISTKEIYELVRAKISKIDHPTSYRYSLKRGLFELGPSGFPFEKLIGRLFTNLGYQMQTNVMVNGKCVVHEVDGVGETKNEIIWIECKFHNTQGAICDLKTALYVYARYLDLAENSDDARKKTMWLVTNTRFSSEAIQFLECRNVQILGWDYPLERSLNVLLERFKLYPVTCVNVLSKGHKQELIRKGIITTQDFQRQKAKISRTTIPERKIWTVHDDLEELHR